MLATFNVAIRQLAISCVGISNGLGMLCMSERNQKSLKVRKQIFAKLADSADRVSSLFNEGLHYAIRDRLGLSMGKWLLQACEDAHAAVAVGGYYIDSRFDAHAMPQEVTDNAKKLAGKFDKRHTRAVILSKTKQRQLRPPSYYGDGLFKLGSESIRLAGQEQSVLEALVTLRACDLKDLKNESRVPGCAPVLKKVARKYQMLRDHITATPGHDAGGYRTTIIDRRKSGSVVGT